MSAPWPSPFPVPPAPSLHALLRQMARDRAQATVLRWHDPAGPARGTAWSRLTFAELDQRADAIAHALTHRHGLRESDRVAWLGLNHPAQIALLFALARVGAMLVPLNHRLSPAEWATVLQDSSPQLLVHDDTLQPSARALASHTNTRVLSVHELPIDGESPINATGTADHPALLVYTSGTTGTPKGAVHTQAHLLANMAIAAQAQGMHASDTVLTVLPLFHVGGLCIQTLPALAVGAQVLLHARFDPTATLQAIGVERPTLTLQVPATLQALTTHPGWPGTDLSSLRAIWAGSSLLPATLIEACHARGVPVCNVYGSTETGPFSIALPATHAASHLGSCGWPAPGVHASLRDVHEQPVAEGAVGEVWVRAPNVVRRYWPDVPACDADGFFHTGDLAQQAADGSFTIVGRAKDMLISGGENIYPAEIENLLAQHPWVAECAVIGQPDARWGEVVVAVVVLHAAAGTDWTDALRNFLDGRLARYKWPRRWHRVNALPRTALGKVQKSALPALLP
ncbi:class I adenylate-forming enzyme family protein [Hydrogenophaga sp. BPS33]|uniref:class I adenylate-forming enzyme family protein n=1 Tax=Hydrogenophaga sp. BPS33 TaxID=2651974 RepID=UPI00132000C8|nr:AMP-binding protein [Hydrogenophaga sp. BPS33]QHE83747.1 long-chain fatty acid--CoA ligase [Hydrogenophaga sp. BPS33]